MTKFVCISDINCLHWLANGGCWLIFQLFFVAFHRFVSGTLVGPAGPERVCLMTQSEGMVIIEETFLITTPRTGEGYTVQTIWISHHIRIQPLCITTASFISGLWWTPELVSLNGWQISRVVKVVGKHSKIAINTLPSQRNRFSFWFIRKLLNCGRERGTEMVVSDHKARTQKDRLLWSRGRNL